MKKRRYNVSSTKLPLGRYESSVDSDSEEEALAVLRLNTPLTNQVSPPYLRPSDDSDSEEESEADGIVCKICDSKTFKLGSADDLVRHTLQHHPTACVSCFGVFLTFRALHEHLLSSRHEPLVCRRCCRVFSSVDTVTNHKCKENIKKMRKMRDADGEDKEDEEFFQAIISDISKTRLPCQHCPKMLFNSGEMRDHTAFVHPTVCPVCFIECNDPQTLKQHQRSSNHRVWPCSSCNFVYLCRSDQQRHIAALHPPLCPFQCDQCDEAGFFRLSQLQFHKAKHRSSSERTENVFANLRASGNWGEENFRFACGLCRFQAGTAYGLLLHMAEEHPNPDVKYFIACEACEVGFGQFNSFFSHVTNKHGADARLVESALVKLSEKVPRREYACDNCPRRFDLRWLFQRHLKRMHPDKLEQRCDVCDFRCLDKGDLHVHVCEEHCDASYYRCPKCEMTEESTEELTRHLKEEHNISMVPHMHCIRHGVDLHSYTAWRTHKDAQHKNPSAKEFVCDICDKSLKSGYSLNRHQALHRPTKIFKCSACSKSYHTAASLKAHAVLHSNKFCCSTCGRSFAKRQMLDRHRVVHSDERPFRCDTCGESFRQKSVLDRHRVVHSDERPFRCDTCGESFRRKSVLDRHRWRRHQKEEKEGRRVLKSRSRKKEVSDETGEKEKAKKERRKKKKTKKFKRKS